MTTTTTTTAQATITLPASVKATKAIKADVDRLRALRAQAKAFKAEQDALTATILAHAGEAKSITWGQTTLATIVDSKSVRADLSILKQAFPEAYEASYVETPYKQVR